ncbi:hypothetical protein D3C86_1675660 [compost metagenome]
MARLKAYGSEYRIETISQKGEDYLLKVHIDQNSRLDGQKLLALSKGFDGRIKLNADPQLLIVIRFKGLKPEASIELLEKFLVQYKDVLKTKGELQDVAK